MNRENMMADIQKDWSENLHWENIKRTCSVADVVRLSGLVHRAYTDARLGSERLWNILKEGSQTNKVVRLSLIIIIFTLVVAIGGCSTTSQYQYNQRERYNYEEGVEQDQEEESKQDQKAAEQGDASAQDNQSDRYNDTNTLYTSGKGGFIICTKKGVEELRNIRLSQIENRKTIDPADPSILEHISEDECIFRDTKVLFDRIATEYNLPASEGMVFDPAGDESCLSNPAKRCSLVNTSLVQYVESSFLGDDGSWYNGFVEMGASFKLLDKPEDTQAGDGTPNNTLSQ